MLLIQGMETPISTQQMHVQSRLDFGSPPKSLDRAISLNTDLAHAVVPPLPLKDQTTTAKHGNFNN